MDRPSHSRPVRTDNEHRPPPLDQAVFRDVMSTFPAGVVVVTAIGADRRPAGLTVSAFCSVSSEPALVLVCVDKGSNTLAAIEDSGAFSVNILAAGREELALLFASKSTEKFGAVVWEAPALPDGGPVLRSDAAGYVVCRVEQAVEAGDHWVFIGEALEARTHGHALPLLYCRRAFSAVP